MVWVSISSIIWEWIWLKLWPDISRLSITHSNCTYIKHWVSKRVSDSPQIKLQFLQLHIVRERASCAIRIINSRMFNFQKPTNSKNRPAKRGFSESFRKVMGRFDLMELPGSPDWNKSSSDSEETVRSRLFPEELSAQLRNGVSTYWMELRLISQFIRDNGHKINTLRSDYCKTLCTSRYRPRATM